MRVNKREEHKLLVGAPRANDSSLPGISEPGAIFRCNWRYRSSCHPIFVDYVGNEKQVFRTWRNITVDHKKDHQWLGGSIDVNVHGNSNVMICAPRWIEKQYHLQSLLFMNGLCYESNKELEFDETSGWPVFDNLKKQIHANGKYYIYGMGMLGSSVAYSKDGQFAVLGSPGLNDFAGGFVHIRGGAKKKPRVLDIPVEASNSYFGSSVITANFTKDSVSTVVGGPRAGGAGKVFVYDSKFQFLFFKEGEQFNLELYKPTLSGSGVVGARFGTAVANLGDLNLDGYQDLAVGAPFEGGGVVYIYNGANFGMYSKPSQRIVGKNLHKSLKAFGWSFSRPLDVNHDHYKDFAVGSFESDKVVLLRTRSVLDLYASFTLSPRIIDLTSETKQRSIKANICFKYSGQNLHPSSEVNMTLTLDVIERHRGERSRLFLLGQNNQQLESLQQIVMLRLNRNFCFQKKLFVRVGRDVVTPLQMQLDFDIASSSIGIASECEICPIRNKYNPTVTMATAQFALDCGLDHQCHPKLKVQAKPLYSNGKSTFLVDDTPYFDLEITVSNTGETSYLTVVTVAYPAALHFSYAHSEGKGLAVSCFPAQNLPNSTLAVIDCDIMSPLKSRQRTTFKARFYGYGLPYTVHEFDINIGAFSAKTDINKNKMKMLSVTIPVKMSTQMKFSGVSIPGQMSFPHKLSIDDENPSSSWVNFSHFYVLRNLGPSPMPHGQIILTVPSSEWVRVSNVLIETKAYSRSFSHVPVDCSLTEEYVKKETNHSAVFKDKQDSASVVYKVILNLSKT
ncbi:integrin alpha-4-like [Elysia marginata]|uniref:Integrin alpha-4-like n=1 Tax=Elysia marginata TaxID=1093978 RepID=A0AAV4IH35_9GAST|nr:integrin alpha-4-like [Elysia marginata]